MDFLKLLIVISEKAANIARICKQDEYLFQLLVEQKNDTEANPRFVADFKTLADVLIQEMVKHDIGKQYPTLSNCIHGEENNIFSNKLGETICVQVQPTEGQTSNLLRNVLNGDNHAADLLAAEVHREIEMENIDTKLPNEEFLLDLSQVEVWIDPIDCTAEYINGTDNNFEDSIICTSGLQCVTVLIGVYDRNTQLPVIGILNQPFVQKENSMWRGRCHWGISSESSTLSSTSCNVHTKMNNNIITISSSENWDIKRKLYENGFKLVEASGAGHKIFTVIQGLADAYVLSKNSTYKWDTCAPHAILRALGGNIVSYEEALQNNDVSVKYSSINDGSSHCNQGGIIAFQSRDVLDRIVLALQ